jgi:small-conductance mechanosensitive channel
MPPFPTVDESPDRLHRREGLLALPDRPRALRAGRRALLWAVPFLALPGALAGLAFSQTSPAVEAPAARKEPKKLELHRLSNEQLLKQAQALLAKSSEAYLAQQRELALLELLHVEARKRAAALVLPQAPPRKDDASPLEAAKSALDHHRARVAACKRRLELAQDEKSRLGQMAASLEACQSAALAFTNALEDLRLFALEISLRVKDRSLPESAVPAGLAPDDLAERRKGLLADQERWRQKGQEVQRLLGATAKRGEEARKAVLDAEAALAQAARSHAQEQKRQELEKDHAGKAAGLLSAELNRLLEEEVGLTGAYDLSLYRFRARETAASQLRQERAALKQPEVRLGPVARAEDVEQAAQATQKLLAYHKKRARNGEELRAALQALIEQGGAFEGDDAVLGEHRLKLEVVAGALRRAGTKGPGEVEALKRFEGDGLKAERKKRAETASAVQAAVLKAAEDLKELARQGQEAQAAAAEASRRLANLKETQQATLRALKWKKTLRKLSARQVAQAFTEAGKGLEESRRRVSQEREAFRKAEQSVEELRKKRGSLKGPLLRAAENDLLADKQAILDELSKLAGLDRAPRKEGGEPPPGGRGPPGPVDKKSGPGKEATSLQALQRLLATRARIAAEREENKAGLLAALDALEQQSNRYAKALTEARQRALQQQQTAIDLKERVGRRELDGGAIPEGVTGALKRDAIARLEGEATALLNAQARLQQERRQLRQPEAALQEVNARLKEVEALLGRRLDAQAALKHLGARSRREMKDRSEAEKKRLKQTAAERRAAETSTLEVLLRIDTSSAARGLQELLQTYYEELVELEEKDGLLQRQIGIAERLVELAQKEAEAVTRLQPLLRRHLAQLGARKEEEHLLARARLRPEKADELLRSYQAKTGKQLPRPAPVADKDKPGAVQEAAAAQFALATEVEAARRWEGLLGGRLAPTGIQAEIAQAQEELGGLNAAREANMRRIRSLTDRPAPGVGAPADKDAPAAEAAGPEAPLSEIARARNELLRVRKHGALWIVVKIGLVLLAALVLPRVLTLLLRWLMRSRDRLGGQSGLLTSFLQAASKLVTWAVALVLILSILGFDITAILAGLGIGGLAIGLASQHMISDVIAGLVIFLERPFSIGDTIRIGGSEPAKVTGLTWRMTQLRNADGTAVNVPNRKVTEAPIQNLTRAGRTLDSVSVSIPTAKHRIADVVALLSQALSACERIAAESERGVTVEAMELKGSELIVRYSPWWYITDFEHRNQVRDEVLNRISKLLAQAPNGSGPAPA